MAIITVKRRVQMELGENGELLDIIEHEEQPELPQLGNLVAQMANVLLPGVNFQVEFQVELQNDNNLFEQLLPEMFNDFLQQLAIENNNVQNFQQQNHIIDDNAHWEMVWLKPQYLLPWGPVLINPGNRFIPLPEEFYNITENTIIYDKDQEYDDEIDHYIIEKEIKDIKKKFLLIF